MKGALFLVLMIAMITPVAADINWATATGLPDASLSVTGQQTYPSPVSAGDKEVILQVDVTNYGYHTYSDLTLKAYFAEPFTAVQDTYFMTKMEHNQEYTAIFRFNVSDDTDPGVYSIPFRAHYTDMGSESTVYLMMSVQIPVSSTPRLGVKSIDLQGAEIGSRFRLNITLENTASMPASGVNATLSFTGTAPSINFLSSNPMKAPLVGAHSTADVIFEGEVTPFAMPGAYPATLTLSFNGQTVTSNFVFAVGGQSDFDISNLQSVVEQGKQQILSFDLRNPSSSVYTDATISLGTTLNMMVADNSYSLGTIAGGETKRVSFTVIPDRAATDGVYPLTITVRSAQGTKIMNQSILVRGKPDLRLAGVSTDIERPKVGDIVSISVQLENTGTGDARAVNAVINNSAVGLTQSFIGTIKTDDTGTAIFDLIIEHEGAQSFPVHVFYEDNNGQEYSFITQANVYVYNTPFDPSPIVIIVLAVIVLGYLFYRRKSKLKQLKKVR